MLRNTKHQTVFFSPIGVLGHQMVVGKPQQAHVLRWVLALSVVLMLSFGLGWISLRAVAAEQAPVTQSYPLTPITGDVQRAYLSLSAVR
jgi:hypothetical protein